MKRTLIISITLLAQLCSKAQSDTASPQNTASTMTIGLVAANTVNYYGQKSQEKLPYIALAASYQHRSGFCLNALTYRLLNDSNSLLSAAGLGAGFDLKLTEKWSAGIGYNYSFYPKHSPFLQAANPHTLSGSLSRKGWLTTKAAADLSFGKTNDLFTTFSLSKAISLFSFSDKDVVTLSPVADVTFGTQRFYSYYVREKAVRDSLAGAILDPIFGNSENPTPVTKTNTTFNLLSYNLSLPLSYNRSSYTIELASQFSVLGNKSMANPGKLNSFFTASFYYQF